MRSSVLRMDSADSSCPRSGDSGHSRDSSDGLHAVRTVRADALTYTGLAFLSISFQILEKLRQLRVHARPRQRDFGGRGRGLPTENCAASIIFFFASFRSVSDLIVADQKSDSLNSTRPKDGHRDGGHHPVGGRGAG